MLALIINCGTKVSVMTSLLASSILAVDDNIPEQHFIYNLKVKPQLSFLFCQDLILSHHRALCLSMVFLFIIYLSWLSLE